jgi:hypothetical protein
MESTMSPTTSARTHVLSRHVGGWLRSVIVVAVLLELPGGVAAQADTTATLAPAAERRALPGQLSGTVGAAVEAYGMNGATARRPGAASRMFADMTFSLFGLSSGFNLLLTTEEEGNRQAINRLGYVGAWRWGQLHAGDVNLSYSPYSVHGTTLRGAGLELSPAMFVFAATHGRTRRAAAALPGIPGAPGYDRTLTAVRIGPGRTHGTHVHLIGVNARDHGVTDTLRGAPTKENVSLTPDIVLVFAGGNFRMNATATVSAVTRERASTEILAVEEGGLKLLTDIFSPRFGSRVDYAGQVGAEIRRGPAGLHASFERVNPGFESLGVGYLRSDQQTIRLRPRVRVAQRLNLDGTLSTTRDNLLGDRLATQRRSEAGINAQTQFGRVTLAGGYLLFQNEATPGSAEAAELAPARLQRMHSVTLTPALQIPGRGATQVVIANLGVQRLADESPGVMDTQITGFDNLTTTLTYVLALPSGVSFNAGGNWLRNDAGILVTQVTGVTAGAGWSRRALTLNTSGGVSGTRTQLDTLDTQSRQLRLNVNAAYRHARAGTIRLGVNGLSNTPGLGAGSGFRELRSELRYERSFATR